MESSNSAKLAQYSILRKKIENLNDMYYNNSTSLVEDAVYDGLKIELTKLEEELKIYDHESPTQTVGAKIQSSFEVKQHVTPMLSLLNAFDAQEIIDWLETIPMGATVSIEPKLDGLSLDLVYENGMLVRGLTRGDGVEGEDVTENARHVWGVQTQLSIGLKDMIEIRGEVLVAKKAFDAINKKIATTGKKTYANPRNYAAGSLRLKDPMEVFERHLSFIAYDFYAHGDINVVGDRVDVLSLLGFRPCTPTAVKLDTTKAQLEELLERFLEEREKFEWEIDGLVFKVEEPELRDQMGSRSNTPRWAIAYKFPAEEAVSVFNGVTWQIGKSGVVTPVANIKPVRVGGVTVSNITLHNVAEIERLGIRIGDHVVVVRRGDVIPKIESVLTDLRSGTEHQVVYPSNCPACNAELERMTHSLYCPNNSGCPDQSVARLVHFVSRDGMDIKHLGEAAVVELVRNGLVGGYSSLFYLNDADLKLVYPNSEVSRKKIIDSINASKVRPFRKVIFAVGMPGVGEGTSERLADQYKSFSELCQATEEELAQIPDIGGLTAKAIFDSCQQNFREYIAYDKLFTYKDDEVDPTVEQDLVGKRAVVSGTLFTLPNGKVLGRSEMEKLVKARGAKLASGISGNVDIFFAGAGAGPEKVRKAISLGFTQHDGYYEKQTVEQS